MRGGRKRGREEGSKGIYTSRFQNKTEEGEGGCTDASDLLTKTQGGTSATLTQQHFCVAKAARFSTNEVTSAAGGQKPSVKFREEFPSESEHKGDLSAKVLVPMKTQIILRCGHGYTEHKYNYIFYEGGGYVVPLQETFRCTKLHFLCFFPPK